MGCRRRGGRSGQLAFELRPRGRGGARPGAGRKPTGKGGVPHRARPRHRAHQPVHATLRVCREIGKLREKKRFAVVKRALREGRERPGFRMVHFSVQRDHVHLIVEAVDARSLSGGLRGLSIRLARALNRLLGRSKRVFADRYHARALGTPREVRICLAYLYNNARRHAAKEGWRYASGWVDPCTSAAHFDGWSAETVVPPAEAEVPVARARTWLLRCGWRKRGLIGSDEVPGVSLAAGPGRRTAARTR